MASVALGFTHPTHLPMRARTHTHAPTHGTDQWVSTPVQCLFPVEPLQMPPSAWAPGPQLGHWRMLVSEPVMARRLIMSLPTAAWDGGLILFIISTAPQGSGPELLICFPAKPRGP